MNEQKPHKWEKEICAWAGGARIENRITLSNMPWMLYRDEYTPEWDSELLEFRIYDKHREVKEAMARGELCQFNKGSGWIDAIRVNYSTHYNGSWDDREWRIAPKPDPYQHLRDAIRAGKKIEFRHDYAVGAWIGIGTQSDHNPDRTFSLPPNHYRIAPKPDSSVNGANQMICDNCPHRNGCKDFDCELQFGPSGQSCLKKISTPRVQTQTELARQTICRLVDALNSATTRDALDLYLALISADRLALGKVLSKIDDDYINFTSEDDDEKSDG